MKNFLLSQAYFLKKDDTTKSIGLLFLVSSVMLVFWLGSAGGLDMSSLLQPLSTIQSFSLLLYFVIPVHVCTFATEGFEYGSIKNIIASGRSRSSYFFGKYLSEIKIILWWLLQFFGLYYLLFMIAALVTQSYIGSKSLVEDSIRAVTSLGFNFLYLSAYCAIVMMIGTFVRKTATISIVTFFLIFGEFMMIGYFKDTPNHFMKVFSSSTLMTQVMKFSGIYVVNSKHIVLAGLNDYLRTGIFPIVVIALCLTITIVKFQKSDIH